MKDLIAAALDAISSAAEDDEEGRLNVIVILKRENSDELSFGACVHQEGQDGIDEVKTMIIGGLEGYLEDHGEQLAIINTDLPAPQDASRN